MAKTKNQKEQKQVPEQEPKKDLDREEPQRADSPALPYAIVGIGASAGGLEALEQFFTHTPGDTGLAFVVIMH